MSALQGQLVGICAGITFLSGFSEGATGFGGGILLQVVWNVLAWQNVEGMDLERAQAVSTLLALFGSGVLVIMDRKHIRKDISSLLAPGVLAAPFLGTWLLVTLSTKLMSLVLGVVFFAVASRRFSQIAYHNYLVAKGAIKATEAEDSESESEPENQDIPLDTLSSKPTDTAATATADVPASPPPPDRAASDLRLIEVSPVADDGTAKVARRPGGSVISPAINISASPTVDPPPSSGCAERIKPFLPKTFKEGVLATVVGLASGFLSGAFGTGGPPLMIYFSLIEDMTKEHIRGTSAFLDFITVPVRTIACFIFGVWRAEDWPVYITVPFSTLAGLWVGNKAHKAINKNQLNQILMLLVFLSSIQLMKIGDGSNFGTVMLALVCFVAFALLTLSVYTWTLKRLAVPKVEDKL